MKRRRDLLLPLLWATALAGAALRAEAVLPDAWAQDQDFTLGTNGLVKISLPLTTLNAARPALEDLRLYDEAGREQPYLIEVPVPAAKRVANAKSFQISLNASTTLITLGTGLSQPIAGVTLETPAQKFIKAVRVEGSANDLDWQLLAQGQPIFREPYGASHTFIALPAGPYAWLRVTVDDQRSPPIPFTGATIHAAAGAAAPVDWVPATVVERDENPGCTRLALNLGAANLNVAEVHLQTTQPLFMRQAALAMPQINGDSLTEQTIAQGALFRVAVAGQSPAEKLSVALEKVIPAREMYVFITNGDSPPLPITSVRLACRPVYLVFLAPHAGIFHLLTGNPKCAAPVYDLAALNLNVPAIAVAPVTVGPPVDNAAYHAPEVLPGLAPAGAALDVAAWGCRQPVKISRPGVQQIEFDPAVLAHARPDFADVRLMHGSNQVPYILQRTSISRRLDPVLAIAPAPKNPKMSRWTITFPRAGLPVTRLACKVRTPLFERTMWLEEEFTDERGDQQLVQVGGGAGWRQTPNQPVADFALSLATRMKSATLILETDNGDNPPIDLGGVTAFYPVTRLLCKANPQEVLYLYYGQPRAGAPSYDLSLVANQLLAAEKQPATLMGEESLKPAAWAGNAVPGKGGMIFWGVLFVVMVVLLVIIARLLPKPPPV